MITNIQFQSDYFVRLKGPEDLGVDPDDVNRLLSSGTATYSSYDPGIDTVLDAAEALGQTILSVSDAGLFKVGYRLELTQDNGTLHNSSVVSVDASAGTVTINDVTTVAAALGNRVRRVFTSTPVAMTLFGTPVVGSLDWGYRGVLADDGPHQFIDQLVTAKMILDAGPGIKITKNECLKVVESCE